MLEVPHQTRPSSEISNNNSPDTQSTGDLREPTYQGGGEEIRLHGIKRRAIDGDEASQQTAHDTPVSAVPKSREVIVAHWRNALGLGELPEGWCQSKSTEPLRVPESMEACHLHNVI